MTVLLSYRSDLSIPKIELLLYTGPFILLAIDWTFNRIYIPASVLLFYPVVSYMLFVVYKEIVLVENSPPGSFPELNVFEIE